jgi:hypothetical protein
MNALYILTQPTGVVGVYTTPGLAVRKAEKLAGQKATLEWFHARRVAGLAAVGPDTPPPPVHEEMWLELTCGFEIRPYQADDEPPSLHNTVYAAVLIDHNLGKAVRVEYSSTPFRDGMPEDVDGHTWTELSGPIVGGWVGGDVRLYGAFLIKDGRVIAQMFSRQRPKAGKKARTKGGPAIATLTTSGDGGRDVELRPPSPGRHWEVWAGLVDGPLADLDIDVPAWPSNLTDDPTGDREGDDQ